MNTAERSRQALLRALLAFVFLGLANAPVVAASGEGHHEEGHHEEEHHEEEHREEGHPQEARSFTVHELEAYGVVLATGGPGVVDIGIELPGEIRPNADRLAHIAPRFPGIVREVYKNTGDPVRAGEVMALIESENLATYELVAAFGGTVIDKHITPGEAVTRAEPAYIVADLSDVWVNINVYQMVLPAIHTGQSVLISTTDGALEATGAISYIAPVVDQATRTATARVVLPNPDGRWRPGLFVIATVGLPTAAAVVVPRRALHNLDGERVIFVAEGEHFVARHVTVGAVGRQRIEITSGLVAGEHFADTGSFLVKAELTKGTAEHHH
jgi:cobalt-zinc-cadmium efflux system membrane fusion protein